MIQRYDVSYCEIDDIDTIDGIIKDDSGEYVFFKDYKKLYDNFKIIVEATMNMGKLGLISNTDNYYLDINKTLQELDYERTDRN